MKAFMIFVLLALVCLPATFTARAQTTGIAASNDCAVTWQSVTVPNVGDLNAVAAISTTDIWAGGTGDFLHWNGTAWSQVAKPAAATITRISATGSNDVWAFAATTVPDPAALFHWNGTSWATETLPSVSFLNDLAATAPNDVWVVGAVNAFHWNGTVWEEHSPDINVSPFFYSVTAADGHVYAGGSVGYHIVLPAMYEWNGTTWGVVHTGAEGYVRHVAAAPDTVVGIGPMQPSPQAMIWNGASWDTSVLPDNYAEVAVLASDDAYVVGKNILHWDGAEWGLNYKPAQALKSISALSTTDLWAVGEASTVLHGTSPCAATGCAQASVLIKPAPNAQVHPQMVTLKWAEQNCATRYNYVVKQDTKKGARVERGDTRKTEFTTRALERSHDYFWRVRACNAVSCGAWSEWSKFHLNP